MVQRAREGQTKSCAESSAILERGKIVHMCVQIFLSSPAAMPFTRSASNEEFVSRWGNGCRGGERGQGG